MESEGSRWQNAGLIRLIKGAVQFIEQAEEVMGRDWVERLADVIVAGDLFDLEKGPGVVAAVPALPVPSILPLAVALLNLGPLGAMPPLMRRRKTSSFTTEC